MILPEEYAVAARAAGYMTRKARDVTSDLEQHLYLWMLEHESQVVDRRGTDALFSLLCNVSKNYFRTQRSWHVEKKNITPVDVPQEYTVAQVKRLLPLVWNQDQQNVDLDSDAHAMLSDVATAWSKHTTENDERDLLWRRYGQEASHKALAALYGQTVRNIQYRLTDALDGLTAALNGIVADEHRADDQLRAAARSRAADD